MPRPAPATILLSLILAGCGAPDPCARIGGDSDGDGFCDLVDTCPAVADPDQSDADGDGRGDACDPLPAGLPCAGLGHDDDGDGLCSAVDRCPDLFDPDQADADGDGLGDLCDPSPRPCDADGGDVDQDGICGALDNCPDLANPTQADRDLDGTGDRCDPDAFVDLCAPAGGDADGDGVCTPWDLCPDLADPDQRDTDGDGLGDLCDPELCNGDDDDGDGLVDPGSPDADGDGIADCVDPCPDRPAGTDADADAVDDCVDPCPGDPGNDPDGDGVCAAVDTCPGVRDRRRDTDRDGVDDACDAEVCNGLDDNGNGRVDEQTLDSDGDRRCDAIDPCPHSATDDTDGDGLCDEVDRCVDLWDPEERDADGDGLPDLCSLLSERDCGEPAPLLGPTALPTSFQLGAVAAQPGQDVIYLSMRANSPTWPNHVLAVHAPTRRVLWRLPLGPDPGLMALSEDGALLYVAVDADPAVRVVQTGSRRACAGLRGQDAFERAEGMRVMPGPAGRLVITWRVHPYTNGFRTVAFDHAARLPRAHCDAFAAATTADRLVPDPEHPDGWCTWTEEGLVARSAQGSTSGRSEGLPDRWVGDDGAVYDLDGDALIARTPLRRLPLDIHPDHRVALYAEAPDRVHVFDLDRLFVIRTVTIERHPNPIRAIHAWGDGGFVVESRNRVTLVDAW